MTYHACIFDLDGVITDTAHYHFLAWQQLANSLELDFTEEDNHRLKGVSRKESLEYILDKSHRTFSDNEKAELANQKNEHYKSLIKNITPTDLMPGIDKAIAWLQSQDWKIGLASASRNAPQVIESLGIAHVFDYVADAGAIPRGKPAPDIFLDVSQALGVSPAHCIGIEDAAAGVAAIKSAAMFAVGIGDTKALNQADIIMPTPEGLCDFLVSKAA